MQFGRLSSSTFLRAACFAAFASLPVMATGCGSDDTEGANGSGGTAGSDAGWQDGSSTDGAFLDGLAADTTGEGATGEGGCGGEAVLATPVKVNLLVVLDRSGSMKQIPSGFTDTKWSTMVGALESSLTAVQDQMAIGLVLFPDPSVVGTDGCGMSAGDTVLVEVDDGTVTVPLITAGLGDVATAPAGNTPTADALALAGRYFTVGPGSQREGEKVVLLALDGGPNCNASETCDAADCTTNIDRSATDPSASACPIDPASCCGDGTDAELNKSCLDDQGTVDEVTQLATAGVSTFVVGIPGSAPYAALLDALAEAGGRAASTTSPKYFEVADAQQLTDTLESITKQLVRSCEFQLEQGPPDPDKVNVYIDGEVVPKDGADGWEYDNSTDPPTIVIKGQTCEDLIAQGAESVSFAFGCPTVK